MGCCCSRHKFDVITQRTLQEAALTQGQTKKLVRLFARVDADGNGVIQADEFFDFFDLQPNLTNKLVFSCYDLEENGEMTFIQFVCTLWTFFTLTPEKLGLFIYFIFDLKKQGTMTVSEVPNVVKQLHRKYFDDSPALQAAVNKLVKGPGGKNRVLSPEDFALWTASNPDVYRPILGKQKDMIHKAYRDGFWKPIAHRKAKEERLDNVYYLYRFMKRIRGNREVFTKKLSSVEEAEQARVAAIAAENNKNNKFKAEKAAAIKRTNSKTMKTTCEKQVSYFDMDDIDQLMDGFTEGQHGTMAPTSKKKSKKSKNGKKGSKGTDSSGTKAKELPPLVLKALQKGTLSSATIAPMDNSRISNAARERVQADRENALTAEEKKAIHARKAAKYNRTLSNEHNLFH